MSSTQAFPISFRVTGLPVAPFRSLFHCSDEELATRHATRVRVDHKPGFPDRVALRDAEVGESAILVNHAHLTRPGPYRASHAIYVIEGETRSFDGIDVIPDVLRSRMLSLRAFDDDEQMVGAALVDGREVESALRRMLADPAVSFIHVHYATRGCYACRVDRADGH